MSGLDSSLTVSEIVPLLYVRDMQSSLNFYCEILGFRSVQTWETDGAVEWCRLELGDTAVMLQLDTCNALPVTGEPPGRGVIFYFNCSDVELLYKSFVSRGLSETSLEVAFYGMKQLELTDPNGYQLCFQSPAEEV